MIKFEIKHLNYKSLFKMQIIKLEIMISILIKIIKNIFYTTTKEGNELNIILIIYFRQKNKFLKK